MDQDLFEPLPDEEEEREPTSGERIWRAIRALITLVAILGLIYLSGIYQSTLFRRTPSDANESRIDTTIVEEEVIKLPIQIFVLGGGGNLASLREEADVDQLMNNANAIWSQADIELSLEHLEFLELTDEEIHTFLNDPYDFVPSVTGYREDYINVFLAKTLLGINGVAFRGLTSTSVADFTTVNDFRTFAHEVGHILSLNHVPNRNQLMAQGTNGIVLSDEEIEVSRVVATEFNTK